MVIGFAIGQDTQFTDDLNRFQLKRYVVFGPITFPLSIMLLEIILLCNLKFNNGLVVCGMLFIFPAFTTLSAIDFSCLLILARKYV